MWPRYPYCEESTEFMAQFLGAVSRVPEIISCVTVKLDIIKTLDRCPGGKVGVQYPYHVNALNLEK